MDGSARDASFGTTRWSVVVRAGVAGGAVAREALAWLFSAYAYPLYAYARRRGCSPEDAQDAVQELFVHALEKGALKGADPSKGRFRSYLLAALDHRLANRRRWLAALRRGGGRRQVDLDRATAEERYRLEPADERTPQRLYEAAWARTLIDRALSALRADYEGQGKAESFDALRPFLADEPAPGGYRALAERLGSTEGALKVAAHRLRKRFRLALEREIAETVENPADVADEIRHLFEALGS